MDSKETVYCARGLRKYLIGITLFSTVVLIGSYAYFKVNAPMGTEGFANAAAVTGVPGPFGATPVRRAVPSPWVQPVAAFVPGEAPPASPFIAVARTLKPSVVNVSATRRPAQQPQAAPAPNPSPNAALPSTPAATPPAPDGEPRFARPLNNAAVESIGSGTIITRDGYILTNYHVVEDTREVIVTVFDARGASTRYPAVVSQRDENRDLALLKITPEQPLKPAMLADDGKVSVGDPVIAIGSPFGLDQTVSQGIISGKHRMMTIEGITHHGLLQTDAAINQGNSGGPLVDVYGYVVGVNTAIYTPTGAFAGVSFAIPASSARAFLSQYVQLREENLPPARGANWGLNAAAANRVPPPIYANAVAPHENRGDCLQCHQMLPVPGGTAGGGTIGNPAGNPVAMNRYTAPANRFAIAPGAPMAFNAALTADAAAGLDGVGIDVQTIDQNLLRNLSTAYPYREGVFVRSVQPASPAAQAGLQPGDILFKLEGRWVKSTEDLWNQLSQVSQGEEPKSLRLSLVRGGRPQDLKLRLTATAPGEPQAIAGAVPQSQQPVAAVPVPLPNRLPPPVNRKAQAPLKTEFEWMGMEMTPTPPPPPTGAGKAPGKAGAVVKEVGKGSMADNAGILAEDIILSINRQPIANAGDLDRAIRAADPRNGILVELDRNNRRMFATLQ